VSFTNLPQPSCNFFRPLHHTWTRSRVIRTFSGVSTCPGVTSPLLLDVLRTCNLASIRSRKEVLYLLWPAPALGEEDFQSLPAYSRSRRVGLLISSRLHSLVASRTFLIFSCPNSLEGEKDFFLCLNLPRGYLFPRCTEDF